MYVRFVIFDLDKYSGRRQGVLQAAAALRDSNTLTDYERDVLLELKDWFNQHLRAPDRFSRRRHNSAHPAAISWFKDSATEYVSRMHALYRILAEHGIRTHMITSDRPGYIVYEDEHQVAAVPFAETAT